MANRFSLRRHVRTQHADMWDDLFPVKCEQCGRRFKCAHQMAKWVHWAPLVTSSIIRNTFLAPKSLTEIRLKPRQSTCATTWIENDSATMHATKRSAGVTPKEFIAYKWRSMQARESTLTLPPRKYVTRSPKEVYQWSHKKDWCPPKIFKNKTKTRMHSSRMRTART